METQTTFTFDPTNALSAMAFVVADQQRVIKQMQEENDVFVKEYKESLAIDKQQYDELDKMYHELQNQYDEDIADLTSKIELSNSELTARTDELCQNQEALRSLDQVNADLMIKLEKLPAWCPCRVETDPAGKHYLTGFDHDGPVILSFYVSEENDCFWDCFNLQRRKGEPAYLGVIVENGIVDNTIIFAVDFAKEIKYLHLSDSYPAPTDAAPQL